MKPKGFAGMDPDKRREIASRGGKAAHAAGAAHKWTPEQARIAGAKGGAAAHKSRGRALDTTRGTDITPQYEGIDGSMLDQ